MQRQEIIANPFALMMDPESVVKEMERSERLARLQSRICRPLDKPLIPKVGDEEDSRAVEAANDADAFDAARADAGQLALAPDMYVVGNVVSRARLADGTPLAEQTSIYVSMTSATDPGTAPEGDENLFILVPSPAVPEWGRGGVRYLHPASLAHALNAFSLGESDPEVAGDDRLAAVLRAGKVQSEATGRLMAGVDGIATAFAASSTRSRSP